MIKNYFIKIILFFMPMFLYGWSEDNSLLVTKNSNQTHELKLDLICNAMDHILFSANYCGGSAGAEYLLAIAQRLNEVPNLKVYGIINDDFITDRHREIIENIKQTAKISSRFNLLITSPQKHFSFSIGAYTTENHSKIIVADNVAVIGGTSVSDRMITDGLSSKLKSSNTESLIENIAGQFRDMDVALCGKVVIEIKDYFFNLYSKWSKITDEKGISESIIYNSPYINPAVYNYWPWFSKVKLKFLSGGKFKSNEIEIEEGEITQELINIILDAQESITFAQMNFTPVEILKDIIQQKKENINQLNIELISNGMHDDMPIASRSFINMNRANYYLLDRAYEFLVPNSLYHKKVIVVDNKISFIGSYNLTYKSAYLDDEVAILIDSYDVSQTIMEVLAEDKQHSYKLEGEEKKQVSNSVKGLFLGFVERNLFKNFI